MSEIKGQLLGILLVLIVFGAVSVSMATVFSSTAAQIAEKSEDLEDTVNDAFTNNQQGLAHWGN